MIWTIWCELWPFSVLILHRPNVCGSRNNAYCCPGWKTLTGGNQCIVREYHLHCCTASAFVLELECENITLNPVPALYLEPFAHMHLKIFYFVGKEINRSVLFPSYFEQNKGFSFVSLVFWPKQTKLYFFNSIKIWIKGHVSTLMDVSPNDEARSKHSFIEISLIVFALPSNDKQQW